MTFSVQAVVRFSAGHRLLGYQGKCLSPHGHSYRADLSLTGGSLDSTGLLADFGDMRQAMREWIDEHWNHAFLLNSLDHAMIKALAAVSESRTYLFEEANPSAENMARTLFLAMRDSIGGQVASVTIWETPDQHAAYSA